MFIRNCFLTTWSLLLLQMLPDGVFGMGLGSKEDICMHMSSYLELKCLCFKDVTQAICLSS